MQTGKVVICGAGFLGSNIAKAIVGAHNCRSVQLASRNPTTLHHSLKAEMISDERLLEPARVDITKPSTLAPVFKDASVVVSLVGVMHGTPEDFDRIQWKGAENVAKAAQEAGAKLVHISAIGADPQSHIPYARTKGLGEQAVLAACPTATVIRPSLVFGPGDGFYARFGKLSGVLPFLPVFGGGASRFQPVYVGDVARAVEIVSRLDPSIENIVQGKVIEAGGPEVYTYREIMGQVLKYTKRRRPIISLPFEVGMLQGLVLEQLPVNLFTVTRAQVEQLKSDNVVRAGDSVFKSLLEGDGASPTSVHDVLPKYL